MLASCHNAAPDLVSGGRTVLTVILSVKLCKNIKEREEKFELTSKITFIEWLVACTRNRDGIAMRFYVLPWRRATQSELITWEGAILSILSSNTMEAQAKHSHGRNTIQDFGVTKRSKEPRVLAANVWVWALVQNDVFVRGAKGSISGSHLSHLPVMFL